jgi:hypothetical protein
LISLREQYYYLHRLQQITWSEGGVEMLSEAQLQLIKSKFVDGSVFKDATHWTECHLHHSACAIGRLIDTIHELRAAIAENCSVTVRGEKMVQEWALDLLNPNE